VNTLYCFEEWRGEHFHPEGVTSPHFTPQGQNSPHRVQNSPLGTKFTPGDKIHSTGDKIHPWGQNSPLGTKFTPGDYFAPRGKVKNLPLDHPKRALVSLIRRELFSKAFMYLLSSSTNTNNEFKAVIDRIRINDP
jgi:hypothetical protein